MTLLDTTVLPFGLSWDSPGMQMASLDHAMWFHRPFRADDWLLYDQKALSTSAGRGPGRRRHLHQRRHAGGHGRAGRPGAGGPEMSRVDRSHPRRAGRRARSRLQVASDDRPTSRSAATSPRPMHTESDVPRRSTRRRRTVGSRRTVHVRRTRRGATTVADATGRTARRPGGHADRARRVLRAGRGRVAADRPAPCTSSSRTAQVVIMSDGQPGAVALDMTDLTERRRRTGVARPRHLARRSAGLRQLHQQRRRHQDRRVRGLRRRHVRSVDAARGAGDRPAVRRTTTVAISSSVPTACCTSAWATAAPAATPTGGHSTSANARQDAAHRPARPAATPRTRCPPTTRSSVSTMPGRRSGRSGCATRGGSASTDRRVTCGSPTSARTSGRRSTSPGRPTAAGEVRTSAGARSRATTGSTTTSRPTAPRHRSTSTSTAAPDCSISGGALYRGAAIPALVGWYVFADYCSGQVRALQIADHAVVKQLSLGQRAERVTAVSEGPDGELYVVSGDGPIYAVTPGLTSAHTVRASHCGSGCPSTPHEHGCRRPATRCVR